MDKVVNPKLIKDLIAQSSRTDFDIDEYNQNLEYHKKNIIETLTDDDLEQCKNEVILYYRYHRFIMSHLEKRNLLLVTMILQYFKTYHEKNQRKTSYIGNIIEYLQKYTKDSKGTPLDNALIPIRDAITQGSDEEVEFLRDFIDNITYEGFYG